VAYGQTSCANCNTVLNWPSSPTPPQYQSSLSQYPDRQQQWYQASPDNQSAGSGSQHQDLPQNSDSEPGLLQLIKSYRGIVAKISIILVIVAALIGAGIALQGQISKGFAAPVVASFDASSPTITAGQEATLHWDVTGASSVSISPDIGTASLSGTRKVSPGKTVTYTLVANNMSGSVRKSVTITVTGILPSINSFSIDPGSIFTGQAATVSWGVTGSTSVSIDPEIGTVSSSGTKNVSPGSTTKYMLTASNSAGNSTASATLTVTSSKAPIITTFSASPASINSGELSTLTWDVVAAKSINISQGIGGVASKGSMPVTPAATTVYTMMAESDYGSVTKSITVTVDTTNATNRPGTAITKTPPEINTFSASQNSIMLGDNITLTWAVNAARTVSISHDVGNVPSSGWTMVIPIATTTYKLSAVNTFGTETAEATVTVNTSTEGTAPVIKSFTAVPSSIPEGGTSSLSWDIKGATILTIDHGIGMPITKYSQPVSPVKTTTYTLTAINSSGTDNATVTVTVVP
jgi:hypothetical protein